MISQFAAVVKHDFRIFGTIGVVRLTGFDFSEFGINFPIITNRPWFRIAAQVAGFVAGMDLFCGWTLPFFPICRICRPRLFVLHIFLLLNPPWKLLNPNVLHRCWLNPNLWLQTPFSRLFFGIPHFLLGFWNSFLFPQKLSVHQYVIPMRFAFNSHQVIIQWSKMAFNHHTFPLKSNGIPSKTSKLMK